MSRPEYTLVLAAKAQDDFEDIISYTLQTWGEQQAVDYGAVIDRALQAIRENPRTGHSRSELPAGYRCFHAGRHLILYRIDLTTIYVVRILHERMDISLHLSEPPSFGEL